MKKLFKISVIFLITFLFLSACGNKSLYSMKTDTSDEKGVEKIIHKLEWKGNKLCDFKIKDKSIEINLEKAPNSNRDENTKELFINGINLLVLNDVDEVNYKGEDLDFSGIDKNFANEILTIKYGKKIEDLRKSEEAFNEVNEKLKNEKFETGAVRYDIMK